MKLILALLLSTAFAQDKLPERNELFWCQQQRNFFADNAASTAAMASRLEKERDALKVELEKANEQIKGQMEDIKKNAPKN